MCLFLDSVFPQSEHLYLTSLWMHMVAGLERDGPGAGPSS